MFRNREKDTSPEYIPDLLFCNVEFVMFSHVQWLKNMPGEAPVWELHIMRLSG